MPGWAQHNGLGGALVGTKFLSKAEPSKEISFFISPILGEIKKSGYLLVLCTKRYPDQKYFQYLTGIENIFEHIPYDSNSQLPSLLLVDHHLEVAVAIVWNVRKISSTFG